MRRSLTIAITAPTLAAPAPPTGRSTTSPGSLRSTCPTTSPTAADVTVSPSFPQGVPSTNNFQPNT